MKKRIIALSLALIMVLGLLPAMAFAAASGVCGDDLTWELDASGELYIEGSGAMYDYTEEDKAPWSGDASTITSVILPDGLTHIGDRAFISMTKLTELDLPASLTSVGAFALNSCTGVTELALPDGLISIGDYGLASMAGLLKIAVPDGCALSEGAFSADVKLAAARLPADMTEIPANLFMGCIKLTDIEIPAGVTAIGSGAFSGCTVLAEITVPDKVESIGEGAFAGCIALTAVSLPESVRTLGASVFSGCTGLTSIRLPSGITEIPESTFAGCTSLKSVNIPAGVTAIGPYAFSACSDLTDVTLPEGLETIGEYAFFNCTSLTSVTIPKSVTSIGKNAFSYWAILDIRPLSLTLYVYTDYAEQYCIENKLKYERITANVIRLAGSNRTKTAVEISKAGFEKADTVVLASGNDFPDALAGGPLAYALRAPILLVRGRLDDATREEIARLEAKKVVILGGELAVSKAVEEELAEKYEVERVAGQNRYKTAVAIAEKLEALRKADGEKIEEYFFAAADNYPDALAISPVAAIKGAPILYIAKNGRLFNTEDYLKDKAEEAEPVTAGTILGGYVAIADTAEAALEKYGITAERLFGTSRYDTNLEINKTYEDILNGNGICVATGRDYPDALTGGVYAAMKAEPLLLVAAKLQPGQPEFIKERAPETVTVFGGTVAVSEELVKAILAEIR